MPLEKLDTEYISISPQGILGKRFIAVYLDFGQPIQPFNPKETQIKDSKGKPMEFNTVIEALNLLNRYDYNLVTAISSGSENDAHTYIMKKNRDNRNRN